MTQSVVMTDEERAAVMLNQKQTILAYFREARPLIASWYETMDLTDIDHLIYALEDDTNPPEPEEVEEEPVEDIEPNIEEPEEEVELLDE